MTFFPSLYAETGKKKSRLANGIVVSNMYGYKSLAHVLE